MIILSFYECDGNGENFPVIVNKHQFKYYILLQLTGSNCEYILIIVNIKLFKNEFNIFLLYILG